MRQTTLLAFFSELSKLSTAFSRSQYQKMFGPKVIRKGKGFVSSKDNAHAPQSTSLTSHDATHSPSSSASRTAEGRETPGGPL